MPDWLDQVDTTPVKSPAAPGGVSGDWLEQVDTTPASGSPVLDTIERANAASQRITNAIGRTGASYLLRVPDAAVGLSQLLTNPLQSAAADQVSAETGGNYSGDAQKAMIKPATAEPWTPSGVLTKTLGAEAQPDDPKWLKPVEAAAPWLIPSGNQLTRAAEAPGTFNKAMTFARSEAGNVADWVASDQAQRLAKEYGFGPLAQALAGMVGGGARVPLARVGSKILPSGNPEAAAKVDDAMKLNPKEEQPPSPPGGPVPRTVNTQPTVPPYKDVADPNSSIASILSGAGAIPFSGTGEKSAVGAQTRAIGRTANDALSQLSPGTTSVFDASPKTANKSGSVLANQSRDAIMNQEQRLIENSNALDAHIGVGTKVDATPLRNEVARIADPKNLDVNETVRSQAQSVLRDLDKSIDENGMITYGALKTTRTTFGQYLDSLATQSTGKANIKPTLSNELGTIKDSLTERMQEAANSKGVGPEWGQNDAGWTLQGEMKRNLADIGGVLSADRTKMATAPGGKQVRRVVANAVEGEGKQGSAPIERIEAGLDEQPARSAVAETIAAYGRPKKSDSTQKFRPATFGESVGGIDSDIMAWIEKKGGLDARQKLETSASAGRGTSEPRQQGGLKNIIGSIVGAAPWFGPAAATMNPAGVLAPILSLGASASHDPDLIRAMAKRSRPFSQLVPQILSHASLGSEPSQVNPVDLARQGIEGTASGVKSVGSTIANYLLRGGH